MDWQAILLSLRLAGLTTLVLFPVGLPIAYCLAFSRRRGKPLVEGLVALPLVPAPTVLSFYVLRALGPLSPVGRFLDQALPPRLPFTSTGLLLASVA